MAQPASRPTAATPVSEFPVSEPPAPESQVLEPQVLAPLVSEPVVPEPLLSEPPLPESPISEPLIPDPADDDPSRRFCLRWPLALGVLVSFFARLRRFRLFGYPTDLTGPAIFICWHSEEMTLLPHCGFTRGRIMISRSRDGDILASVVRRWGYLVSRGSSSRGAVAALRALRQALDQGNNLILAVDGPRGPRRVAKPGAFYLAAKTGRPIYPVGAAVSWAHVFKKSWSRSRLPLPGSKVCAVFGPPLWPSLADLSRPQAEWSAILAQALTQTTEMAENHLKNWPGPC